MAGSVGLSAIPANASFGQDDDPVKLVLCWVRQSCDDCISMRGDVDCSWCPFSSTCVPNPSTKYPLLAPIDHPDICPLGSKERWELRARGLGCNISTRNFLSVVVAVASSFVLVGLIALVLGILNNMIRWRRQRKTRSRGRGHLGIIFFRGWDDDGDEIIEGGSQRRGRRITDETEAPINETSPLLRRDDQVINV